MILKNVYKFIKNKNVYKFVFYQLISIILFGYFSDYGGADLNINNKTSNQINHYYPMYQDVNIMIFIGFGFLMTFSAKYSFTASTFNLLISVLTIQYSILINGLMHNIFKNEWNIINLDIRNLISADFACGCLLITYGSLLGKISFTQLLLLIPLELVFYAINENICVNCFQSVDMGGSLVVHLFGALFGVSVSFMITDFNKIKNVKFESNKNTDLFALIGTLFLFCYWPSFNGAFAQGSSQNRVVINTVLSLCSSCISAFFMSKILSENNKFNIILLQNATLAGGVAVGSSSDLVIKPAGAMLIGTIAGILSVIGFEYITPFLEKACKIHDTCGVLALHGIPGLLGGVSGAISAAIVDDYIYNEPISNIFPARIDGARSKGEQGLYQLYAILTSIGIPIISGLITGFILKKATNDEEKYNEDKNNFEEVPTYDNNIDVI
tara:strand:- start:28 stop:1347 length:1320 start_codon:yes stop_codon:yes gene_type:complete